VTAAASILPLEVSGLCYEAGGRQLVRDVSFRLESGSRSVILGPNGAGKSLTLRMCHGLLRPSAGTVRWQLNPAALHQAMVFQRPVMLRRTARANLEYPLAVRGMKTAERAERIAEALRRTGLSHIAETPARLASVGEQQRLALARAWLLRPEVLFLDEPTASLDPSATRAVEAIIQDIFNAGTKIVLTTQDLGQVRRLGDEVLFLYGGRLLEHAPVDRFFEAPETPQARAFIKGELYEDWNG
jgi:tungstate transport system ATP-binding protein